MSLCKFSQCLWAGLGEGVRGSEMQRRIEKLKNSFVVLVSNKVTFE